MPTTFIAVQCFHCSTMQVKQEKKSSKKWKCVICNEKQSVRKVFAQGFQAKDVRKFVQTFNMSRQLSDTLSQEEEEEEEKEEDPSESHKKRKTRSDWSQYLDPEDLEPSPLQQGSKGDGFEPEVVTELHKDMFKKPKLKNYSPGLKKSEGNKLFSPTFSKRKSYTQTIISQEQNIKAFTQNENLAEKTGKEKCHSQPRIMAQGPSKWSYYLTRDEEDLLLGEDGDFPFPFSEGLLANKSVDQKVEDDVHPDFI